MKHTSFLPALLLAAVLPLSVLFSAEKSAPTPTESELIAKARATYPLKTCLVSGEALGSMGDATPFVYHAAGKPDRVVFFCCEGCTDDFKADPAKFLKKVDDAAAGKKAGPAKDAKHDKKH